MSTDKIQESTDTACDHCSTCNKELGPYEFTRWLGSDGEDTRIPNYKEPYVMVEFGSGERIICSSCYQSDFWQRLAVEDKFQLHYEFGLEYANFGEFESSKACLERAADINRTSDVLVSLARAHGALGDYAGEIKLLRESFERNTSHIVTIHNLIVCLVQNRQFAEALGIIESVLGEIGHDDQLFMWMAEIAHHRKDFAQAAEYYERARESAHCEDCAREFELWWESLDPPSSWH